MFGKKQRDCGGVRVNDQSTNGRSYRVISVKIILTHKQIFIERKMVISQWSEDLDSDIMLNGTFSN